MVFDNFNKDRPTFGVTDKGMAHTESLSSLIKILKYHFVLFMAGVIITVYAITTIELSIVPLVSIGWIWYYNSWLIMAIIFAKLKIPK